MTQLAVMYLFRSRFNVSLCYSCGNFYEIKVFSIQPRRLEVIFNCSVCFISTVGTRWFVKLPPTAVIAVMFFVLFMRGMELSSGATLRSTSQSAAESRIESSPIH